MSKASEEVVEDKATILDKSWERVQRKTFTRWVNAKLKPQKIEPISDVQVDFKDGVKLIQLIEVISEEELGKYYKKPKMFIQYCENIDKAINFIKSKGIKIENLGSNDIADGNLKLILGFIWTLILRWSIADISEEGLNSKAGLLLWCQRKTKIYDNVDVKDFTGSWKDGLAFCALIHRHRPDLIDYNSLSKANKAENLELAFSVAEKELGIERLLDPEDILELPKPDERSIMTYVSSYFHYFSSFDRYEKAGRRIGKFIMVAKAALDMQHDYEQRAQQLKQNCQSIIDQWAVPTFDGTFLDATTQFADFGTFKSGSKRDWIREKQALATLLSSIQAKLQASNLPPYTPPEELNSIAIAQSMSDLGDAEVRRKHDLTKNLRVVKETLLKQYADYANGLDEKLKTLSASLSAIDGPFDKQLESVKDISKQVEMVSSDDLPQLTNLNEQCHSANVGIDENEHTVFSVDDLTYRIELLQEASNKLTSYIENQIVASQMTTVTQQQLAEFEETFRFFDSDHSNALTSIEFKAALAGLGKAYTDEEFPEVFAKVAQGDDKITFEEFVQFMITLEEDKFNPDQIKESFNILASSQGTQKDFLSEADMHFGSLGEDERAFIKENCPKTEDGGYDYNAYLNKMFH